MKKIEINTGQYALVDDEDYEVVRDYKWRLHGGRYASTGDKTVFMHRLILGASVPKWPQAHIDHINNDGLDNRRSNLRVTNSKGNNWNAKRRKDNTTGYKGVAKLRDKFRAYIFVNGKQIYLGKRDTPEEASLLYRAAADKYYGSLQIMARQEKRARLHLKICPSSVRATRRRCSVTRR